LFSYVRVKNHFPLISPQGYCMQILNQFVMSLGNILDSGADL
jgi:hypothetical protein